MASKKNDLVLSLSWDVWISGKKLNMDRKQCITDIQIKETVDGADSCTIKLSDPEFIFIEDNIFLENKKVKVKLGWSGVTYRRTFNGYISTIDIEFGSDGIPVLTLTCMDRTHIMNRKKKNKTFKKTTSANVVKKIVKSYGFKCVIEYGYHFTKQDTITQSDQTDIDFITKLAGDEVYPFTARLVGNTFYYIKKGHMDISKMTLHYVDYPHEIISFNPKINQESKKIEIKSSKSSTKKKKAKTTTIKSSSKSTSTTKKTVRYKTVRTYNPKTRRWTKKTVKA